eukprot:743241-Alexandrium_andersonii.AAC.1
MRMPRSHGLRPDPAAVPATGRRWRRLLASAHRSDIRLPQGRRREGMQIGVAFQARVDWDP